LAALCDIVRASPVLMRTLTMARDWGLPDWWLVSGAIYNQVWNHLTGRAEMYGVKDIDLFYFDPDISWDAEDRIIRHAERLFPAPPPVEVRNQARVHLWYQDHFGSMYPALSQSCAAIDRFACRTHCVGLRLEGDLQVYAPYGLDDIFSFRVTPNPILNNRETHETKAARQISLWPELTIVPWPAE
jgi:uncharacterized protein